LKSYITLIYYSLYDDLFLCLPNFTINIHALLIPIIMRRSNAIKY